MKLALNQILLLAFAQPCVGVALAQENPFLYTQPTQNQARPALTVSFELDKERVRISLDESDWTVTIDGEDAPAERFKARGSNTRR